MSFLMGLLDTTVAGRAVRTNAASHIANSRRDYWTLGSAQLKPQVTHSFSLPLHSTPSG